MNVTTLNGKNIDVSECLVQMRENHRLGRNLLEQTPIGKTADGEFFWWDDEELNPFLVKNSVNLLLRMAKSG